MQLGFNLILPLWLFSNLYLFYSSVECKCNGSPFSTKATVAEHVFIGSIYSRSGQKGRKKYHAPLNNSVSLGLQMISIYRMTRRISSHFATRITSRLLHTNTRTRNSVLAAHWCVQLSTSPIDTRPLSRICTALSARKSLPIYWCQTVEHKNHLLLSK